MAPRQEKTAIKTIVRDVRAKKKEESARAICEARGGTWDAASKTCSFPQPKEEIAPPAPTTEAGLTREQLIKTEERRTLTAEERERLGLLQGERAGGGFDPRAPARTGATFKQFEAGKTAREEQAAQLETQQLVGQVGDIPPSGVVAPTGIDPGEAIAQGLVGAIPRALSFAATGAAIGLGVGAITGPGAIVTGAVGAVAGFVGGLSSSIISNVKSQRTDTTNAQQRVLDEGKQTLKDWSTMAKADPANREFYLSQFNIQLQLIQDAHVQMLTDTNADVAKFESAVPNLAEFNSFYSLGGERDALVNDMIISLQTPVSIDYSMLELTNRRFVKD